MAETDLNAQMESDPDLERALLIREVRQRLESLARAGVSVMPKSEERPPVPRAASAVVAAPPAVDPPPTPVVEAPPRQGVERPTTPPAPSQAPRPAPTPPRPRPIETPTSLFGAGEFSSPVLAPAGRVEALSVLAAEVASCRRCHDLAATRTQTVFADGSPTARLMFIGEAPGAEEDRRGLPFVGKAGQLLTDMITKGMGLPREEVYIANILKCRPPDNRDPSPQESANCRSYLERQVEIVRPEFICLLGRIAASTLLETALSMSRLRGRWHRVMGIPTIATYHPAYLLRTPTAKKDAWDDLQMLMRAMGLAIPKKKS